MSKFKRFNVALFGSAVLFFSSCAKDEEINVSTENYKGVLVVNEGAYGKSNGSLGIYKPGDKTYFDAFRKANDRPLGDIVQSVTRIGDDLFIVVNNSGKIEVCPVSDLKSRATISTPSPRYILPVGNGKAYISNLFSNTVKVLNTSDLSLGTPVNIHHNSEHMALMNGKVYVSTFDNKIMVLDAATDALIDSVSTPSGLGRIVNAGNDRMGVLCTGLVDWNSGNVLENGKILIYNKDSMQPEKIVPLSSGSYGGSMVYVPSVQAFYFSLGNQVIYRMDLSGNISEFKTLEAGQNVYGLSFDSSSASLYVMDAGDFSSAGKIRVFDLSGNKTHEFSAGIAPNSVFINN